MADLTRKQIEAIRAVGLHGDLIDTLCAMALRAIELEKKLAAVTAERDDAEGWKVALLSWRAHAEAAESALAAAEAKIAAVTAERDAANDLYSRALADHGAEIREKGLAIARAEAAEAALAAAVESDAESLSMYRRARDRAEAAEVALAAAREAMPSAGVIETLRHAVASAGDDEETSQNAEAWSALNRLAAYRAATTKEQQDA